MCVHVCIDECGTFHLGRCTQSSVGRHLGIIYAQNFHVPWIFWIQRIRKQDMNVTDSATLVEGSCPRCVHRNEEGEFFSPDLKLCIWEKKLSVFAFLYFPNFPKSRKQRINSHWFCTLQCIRHILYPSLMIPEIILWVGHVRCCSMNGDAKAQGDLMSSLTCKNRMEIKCSYSSPAIFLWSFRQANQQQRQGLNQVHQKYLEPKTEWMVANVYLVIIVCMSR